MKKFLFFLLLFITLVLVAGYFYRHCEEPQGAKQSHAGLLRSLPSLAMTKKKDTRLEEGMALLKARRDAEALIIFDKVLAQEPDNLDALWGKAEALRRRRDYENAECLLNDVLSKDTGHVSSMISLAYIKYKEEKLDDALKFINRALKARDLSRENEALCFLMLGTISSRRSSKGGLLSKLKYGTRVRGYFLKASRLAPGLPEAHLGLGTFYLLAPAIAGGNLDKAFNELELSLKIAPGFATANARLAQYYKKKGDMGKYFLYAKKAKELDPENEALKE